MNNSDSEIQSLILDTHILVWYAEGIKLSKQQADLIDKTRIEKKLFISAITVWEISMLSSKGRLVLASPIKEWVNSLLTVSGIKLVDLSSDILIESSLLPNYEYKDPADRMIISSARITNSHLMTFDQKIINYANLGYLKLANVI